MKKSNAATIQKYIITEEKLIVKENSLKVTRKYRTIRSEKSRPTIEVIVDSSKTHYLHRICAVVDIPRYHIHAGDLGGFIEDESNLSQEGSAWVGNDAVVFNRARVIDDALVDGQAHVEGSIIEDNAHVGDKATVIRSSHISGNGKAYGRTIVSSSRISGFASAFDDSVVAGDVRMDKSAKAYGRAFVLDSVRMTDYAEASEDCVIAERARIEEFAQIRGRSVLAGGVIVDGHSIFLANMFANEGRCSVYPSQHEPRFVYSEDFEWAIYRSDGTARTLLVFEYNKPQKTMFL